MKKKRTWTALILIAALILIFAAPANCEAEDARILLMQLLPARQIRRLF